MGTTPPCWTSCLSQRPMLPWPRFSPSSQTTAAHSPCGIHSRPGRTCCYASKPFYAQPSSLPPQEVAHRPAGGAFIGHLPLRSSPSCCCLLCISAWRPQSPPTKHIKPELMFPPNLLFLMSPLSWLKDSWFSTHDVFQTGNRVVVLQSFSPSPNQPVPRCRGFHFPSESPCCH